MFARLTKVSMKADKLDEVIEIFKKSITPAAKSQKGYRGQYFLTDRKTGKTVGITLWDSEEDAIASEKGGFTQEAESKLKEFFTEPYVHEGYEVSIQA